jgi:hypothetical protein
MNSKKYYSVPYISNSTLTWFKVSPKYCWKRMNLEIMDEEKSYTYLGKQLHLSLLEPEEFEKYYTYLDFKTPTSKQQLGFCEMYATLSKELSHDLALRGAYENNYAVTSGMKAETFLKNANRIYEANVDYIKYLQIKGDFREILSKSKQELITTVTQSIQSHKKANSLMFLDLLHGDVRNLREFNEFAIYWDYPIYYNGEALKCKSLIDRLVVDHDNKKVTIVDLKTTSVLGDLSDQFEDRNYYRQLAFYRLAVQHSALVPNDYEVEAYIVAVNTQDPFECRVYKLSDAEYKRQVLLINELMQAISWHWFTNQWDYSRAYYEGDGTENLVDEYSNEPFERTGYDNRSNPLRVTDAILER